MSEQIETYSKINDLQGIRAMGDAIAKSGMFGCEKTEQGIVIALQCIAENKPPLELAKHYHIIKGKLTKRADAMLADFRKAGGKFIFADLKNPSTQKAKVTFEDYQDFSVEYSLDDAKSAGVYNTAAQSPWQKTPAAMLRARLVSETLRAIAPEIVTGVYTPEEAAQFDEAVKVSESAPKATPLKAQRKPEPKQAEVIDVAIEYEAITLGSLIDGRDEQVNAYFAKKKKINPDFGETWRDLPQDEQDALLADFENFEKAILIGGAK
jgi:hypothetical protein